MLLNWLFPNKCIVCLDILTRAQTEGLCGDCRGAFTEIKERSPEGYAGVFLYDDLMSDVIHAFKYGNHPAHGRYLGRLMAERVHNYFGDIDIIMPVPMYRAKERQRGFNQADILAREIARCTGIAYDRGALRRVRDTAAQSELSSAERKTNLDGAFRVEPSAADGKKILLVDDIMTTGSTLSGVRRGAFPRRRGGGIRIYAGGRVEEALSSVDKIMDKMSENFNTTVDINCVKIYNISDNVLGRAFKHALAVYKNTIENIGNL
jgi:ComF family protein